jgi:repressor LexA
MARSKYTEVELDMIKEMSYNLKRLLLVNGVTQTELSDRTGLPTSTISDYVNGKTLMSPGNLQKIADSLNVLKSDINTSFRKSQLYKSIPLVKNICAEDAFISEQNLEDHIFYPLQNKHHQPDYALRMKDDSMVGAGIYPGDIVYMRYAQWAEHNGQIVAVLLNNHKIGTLKRIKWSEGSPNIILESEGSTLKIDEVLPNEVQISGVYMGHFRQENPPITTEE